MKKILIILIKSGGRPVVNLIHQISTHRRSILQTKHIQNFIKRKGKTINSYMTISNYTAASSRASII